MGRNILVVTTLDHDVATLGDVVDRADAVKVVVPVVDQGVLDWLANDERAFAHAERVAEETADALPAATTEFAAGEENVALAIRDALATFPADEVVLAVRSQDRDALTEVLDPNEGAARSIDGVPLRFVVVR